jgi:metal-dependent amidase/aminoacylase/carboxypeptidase family protein
MTATKTPTARVSTVLAGLDGVRGWQEELYRDLHRHPELSHQERRTAQGVAERLRSAGFEVHEGVGGTGVVGVLRNGDGPTVLLRADMAGCPCGRRRICRMPVRRPPLARTAPTCR